MQKICDQSSEMLIGLYWLIAQDHVGISALSLHARKTSIASWLLEMVLHIDKSPANCGKDILLLPRHFDITGVIEVEATFMC